MGVKDEPPVGVLGDQRHCPLRAGGALPMQEGSDVNESFYNDSGTFPLQFQSWDHSLLVGIAPNTEKRKTWNQDCGSSPAPPSLPPPSPPPAS